MPFEVSARSAARAAYASAAFNLAATMAMALVLKPGLPIPGSRLADRMLYVSTYPGWWWSGWLLWHGAAISLVGFYVGLAGQWGRRSPLLSLLALLCATAGLAADLAAESIYVGISPRLGTEALPLAEDVSGFLTGYLANGLYTVAGILLTWVGAPELPTGLVALAIPVWGAGLCLTGASLVHSAAGQFWSTAVLMPLFIAWTMLVGRWLDSRANVSVEA